MHHNHITNLGEALKSKREELNISIEDISHRLKIKKQDIIYLEQNNLNSITENLYLAGFIKSYCRILKIKNETIDEYLQNIHAPCNTKNKKHQLINLDSEQNKNPSENNLVNAMLIFTIIYLLLISFSQFNTRNPKVTDVIIKQLGAIE